MAAKTAQDFEMHSGDTKEITITVTDSVGSIVVLAGTIIAWGLYTAPGVSTATVTKTTTAGDIAISGNTCVFTLAPADTTSLTGRYYHELEVTDASGVVETTTTGWITILVDTVNA